MHAFMYIVPEAPGGFSSSNATNLSSEFMIFSWNATKGPVILSCRMIGDQVPTIIREFCCSCSPVYVGEFAHSTKYTCTLSERAGVIVGQSSSIMFTTDRESKIVVARLAIDYRASMNACSMKIDLQLLFTLTFVHAFDCTISCSCMQDWPLLPPLTPLSLPAQSPFNFLTPH